nr:thiamine pyrophosphate-dependent enzyme [uncultured Desulfobulbus sp.]
MSENVSDVLVDMLVDAGVRRVYAVTGDSLNPINDAIRRDGRIQWVHVRHEEAGAYAASMDAELNGIGCCMGSSGPGHVHLVNGLYDANRAGNPVIAIASTANTDKLGLEYFQETNVNKLFDDCSKYCFMANTPIQALQGCQSAIQHALGKRGVAVIGLPGDVAAAKVVRPASSLKNYSIQARTIPSIEELEQIAQILNSNKKVMLYCGLGAKDAVPEVLAMAEKLKAPIAYSFRGKIFFDKETNPYAVGLTGLLGMKSGFQAMHEAEVVVLLGTDFPYSAFMPENNTIIQIDIDPAKLGRRAQVDFGYCGDIKASLEQLLPLLQTEEKDDFLVKMRSLYEIIEEKYQAYVTNKAKAGNIHPELVSSVINDQADDDAIFTVDTGMCSVWAARYIKGKKNRYITGSFNHGSMANAMPMAIGSGLSQPGRQVVAMCGDGGLMMMLGDLMTIAQYVIPVKLILFNNRTLGMVKLEMEVAGLPDWQTNMVNPDFAKVGEAMGIKSWTVKEGKDVRSAITEAFAHDGPALVNIFTDPNALAMPPHVDFHQLKGFAWSMGRLMLNGQSAEVVNVATSGVKYLKEIL